MREAADVEGRTFAFGDVSSTSGSLYPSIMLRQAGVDYRTDLEESTYTGGHDTAAQAVVNGQVDAGGIEDRILYDLEEEDLVDPASDVAMAGAQPSSAGTSTNRIARKIAISDGNPRLRATGASRA